MLVVNLFGAPGSGKSTLAAKIFAELKANGIEAELITEFAKDLVYEKNEDAFSCQLYITGNQLWRLDRVSRSGVEVVVTDSPLPLGIIHNTDYRCGQSFYDAVMKIFNSFNNINFVMDTDYIYQSVGRIHTREQSVYANKRIYQLLDNEGIFYRKTSECDVLTEIKARLRKEKY